MTHGRRTCGSTWHTSLSFGHGCVRCCVASRTFDSAPRPRGRAGGLQRRVQGRRAGRGQPAAGAGCCGLCDRPDVGGVQLWQWGTHRRRSPNGSVGSCSDGCSVHIRTAGVIRLQLRRRARLRRGWRLRHWAGGTQPVCISSRWGRYQRRGGRGYVRCSPVSRRVAVRTRQREQTPPSSQVRTRSPSGRLVPRLFEAPPRTMARSFCSKRSASFSFPRCAGQASVARRTACSPLRRLAPGARRTLTDTLAFAWLCRRMPGRREGLERFSSAVRSTQARAARRAS